MPVTLGLVRLVLLDIVTASLCCGQFSLSQDDPDVVIEMCRAQYEAMCTDRERNCTNTSQIPTNVTWLVRCSQTGTNQTVSECQGTCSYLATDEGYVPEQPDVSVSRIPLTQAIELNWQTDPQISSQVVYVIANKQPNTTGTTDRIQLTQAVNVTYQLRTPDICWKPAIRVAAVSSNGSRWFSDVVEIPDLIPDPPQDINVTSLNYDPEVDAEFIFYTLEWRPPDGWSALDLELKHKFDYLSECSQTFLVPLYLFADNFQRIHAPEPPTSADQAAFRLNGRIPVDAIGCNITFSIRAVSGCSDGSVGAEGHYSFSLSCDMVPTYTGDNCGPAPAVLPGPVKDARFLIVPDSEGLLGLVSWRPPDSLGSFSSLDSYHVFWGILDLMNSDPISQLTTLLGHVTVPGTKLETDLDLNVTWLHPEETVGLMITAAGPGQVIDMPFSDIYIPANGVTSATQPGAIIADDDTVIVLEQDRGQSCDVDVFWRRTEVGDKDNLAVSYDIQWGLLPGRGNITDDNFTPTNTSRVPQAYIRLADILDNTTYGIKIVPVFNVSTGACDEESYVWNLTELHTFTVSHGPATYPSTLTPSLSNPQQTTNGHRDTGFSTLHAITVAISGLLASVIVLIIFIRMRRRRHRQGMVGVINMADIQYRDYAVFSPGTSLDGRAPHSNVVTDQWELPLSCVKFGHVLGSGAFGKVVKGQVTRAILTHRGVAPLIVEGGACFDDVSKLHVTVAIKMLQENCDSMYKQDFLKEIQLMKTLGHHRNVVSMLGCCTLRDPICLIVEHAEFGDLLNYLKDVRQKILNMLSAHGHYVNRVTDVLSSQDLVRFAQQVAMGMDFLTSKGFVHRDLAARNILVCANRTCKIGDFGLARYIYDNVVYVNRRGGRLPLKWMSVEAIFDMSFSTASDVWSFGILLYEMVTLGGTPYPTIPTRDLLRELQAGYRMEKPENCSHQLYEMMMQCWQTNPQDRPTFSHLSQWLQEVIQDNSETDHLAMKLGLDPHLYKTDEDVFSVEADMTLAADQSSLTSSQTLGCSRVVSSQYQEAPLVPYKSVSEDSGYCSQQKESVSSGDSTASLPSAAGASSTSSRIEATPRTAVSTRFRETLSETLVDDVFHEGGFAIDEERGTHLGTKYENVENGSSNLNSDVCHRQRRRQKLGQVCVYNSEEKLQKPEDKRKQFWHQSLPNLSFRDSLPVNFNSHIRRKSDSDILLHSKLQSSLHTGMHHFKTQATIKRIHQKKTPMTETFHLKSSSQTTDMPRRTKKPPENKQRRKAVVVPPTLALDNLLYHGGEILRQNPPVVCISRKKQRNNASSSIGADMWACDGEFNFKRAGARGLAVERKECHWNCPELEARTLDTDKSWPTKRSSDCSGHVDVHQDGSLVQEQTDRDGEKSESMSGNNIPHITGSETRLKEADCLPDSRHLSLRTHRTFVRSHCPSILKDTLLLRSTAKCHRNWSIHKPGIHQYEDFKHVIKHSSNASETSVIDSQEPVCHTNTFCDLLLDLKAATESTSRFNPMELESKHPDRRISLVSTRPHNCQNGPLCTEAVDCLHKAVRRTCSSPREYTLTAVGLNRGELQLEEKLTLMLRRRLSDPFVVSSTRILPHSAQCQFSVMSLKSSVPEAESPGLQKTCFHWPHARTRKKTSHGLSKCELESSNKKLFPCEKHPVVLHQVSSLDNIYQG